MMKRNVVMGRIDNLVNDLVYAESDDVTRDDIEHMIEVGELTIADMVDKFVTCLQEEFE